MRVHLTMSWMRRYDVTWVEVIFCGAVIAGFVSLITPTRVRSVIELSGGAITHPTLALAIAVLAAAITVYRSAVNWGPVRIAPAIISWKLSGPATRSPAVRTQLLRVGLAIIATMTLAAVVASLLHPASLLALLVLSCVGAAMVGAAALCRQVTVDRRSHRPPLDSQHRSWSPTSMHRRTIAPADGYGESLGIAVGMMDTTWIDDARVVRWQRRWRSAIAPPIGDVSAVGAILRMDLRRIRRHPSAMSKAIVAGVAAILLAKFTVVHMCPLVVPAVLAYSAGVSVSGGLRQIALSCGLRRTFARSDRFLFACHSVMPLLVVGVWCALVLPFWVSGVGPAVALVVGVMVAVVRRGTRSALPYDSVVMPDPVTGAAIQPLLIVAQLRGLVAAILTGIVVGLL